MTEILSLLKKLISLDYLGKWQRIRSLERQLVVAGDRRDWDQCNRIEEELEELYEELGVRR